jgi:type IV secretory pathway TraG/TraD family ATPase VirD4
MQPDTRLEKGGTINFESVTDLCFRLDTFISGFHEQYAEKSNLHPSKFAKLHDIAPLLQQRKREALLLAIGPYNKPLRVQPTAKKPKIGNVLDIGTSQCSKSTRTIAQDLDWIGSLVVNDIKEEIREKTVGWRSLLGPTFTIAINGRGNKYDPLEGRVTERQLYASAYLLLYNADDKEKYFTERAIRMLTQLFLAAREQTRLARAENPFAKEVRPLPFVGSLVCLGLNRVAAILNRISPPLAEKFLEAEYDPLKDYEQKNARVDAWSSLVNRLYPLLTDDILPTFDGCDFTAKDLLVSKDPVTVYFCWPEAELATLKPLIHLVCGSLMNNLIDAYKTFPQKVIQKLLLDFDEAGVTDLPELPEKAATLNGRGVSISLNAQDLEQFVTLYGQSRAWSLLNNLESKIVHRPASLQTAKYFCEWLAYTSAYASSESSQGASQSEGKSEREVPLLTVRELAELDDDDVLVFHRGYKPIRARRMGITDYPALQERQNLAPPPVPLLSRPTPPEFLPLWRRRSLQTGALRLDAGAYPLYAPEAVAHWPVMYRDEENQ